MTPLQLFDQRDLWRPSFEIMLGRQQAGRELLRDVTTVRYHDSISEIDSFDITVNNWDAATRRFKYSDGDLLDPGKEVTLFMGYRRPALTQMITGRIEAAKPVFPAGGAPTMTVSGKGIQRQLMGEQDSHIYEGKTPSQIAREIATRRQLEMPETDPGQEPTIEHIAQTNEYDLVFLDRLAKRYGYEMWVRERNGEQPRLFFGPSTSRLVGNNAIPLTYGRTLIEFNPELDTSLQVDGVRLIANHPTERRPIDVTVRRREISDLRVLTASGGPEQVDEASEEQIELINDRPVPDEAHARAEAEAALRRILKNALKATGSTVGLPEIRAGVLLRIDGVGPRYSGNYFVTESTHSIGDSGYTVQFGCRREEA